VKKIFKKKQRLGENQKQKQKNHPQNRVVFFVYAKIFGAISRRVFSADGRFSTENR
jgi:hypothetical protein